MEKGEEVISGLDQIHLCRSAQNFKERLPTLRLSPYKRTKTSYKPIFPAFEVRGVDLDTIGHCPASQSKQAWDLAWVKFTKSTRKVEWDYERLNQAISDTLAMFSVMSCEPYTPYESIIDLLHTQSSAGVTSPYQTKQEVVSDDTALEEVFVSAKEILNGRSTFSEAMLKDEIRDRERVSSNKTRIFVSSTMEHMISGYRVCGRQNATMYRSWKELPSTAGMNTFCEWHEMVLPFLALERDGHPTYSADAKSFDSTIPSQVLFVVAHIRYMLSGCNDIEYLQDLLNFYRHTVFDPVLSREDPFFPNGKQKSGFINTYADNCIINVFLWVYCFGFQTEYVIDDVYLRVGGDDVIINTSLDPKAAAQKMLEIFGVEYEFENTTSILEGSFLGAHTVWEPTLHRYVPRYDLQKLLDGACFAKNSHEHFVQRCIGLAPLLVNDRAAYDELCRMFTKVTGRSVPWTYASLRALYIANE